MNCSPLRPAILWLTFTLWPVAALAADPQVDGIWDSNIGVVYQLKAHDGRFQWWAESQAQRATGKIAGSVIWAQWKDQSGEHRVDGRITTVDDCGTASRIEWNNGVVFDRKVQPCQPGANQNQASASMDPLPAEFVPPASTPNASMDPLPANLAPGAGGPRASMDPLPTSATAADPQVDGIWDSNIGVVYQLKAHDGRFQWWAESLAQRATGKIAGSVIWAQWKDQSGEHRADARITTVDNCGIASRIEWNNGVVFSRKVQPCQSGTDQSSASASMDPLPAEFVPPSNTANASMDPLPAIIMPGTERTNEAPKSQGSVGTATIPDSGRRSFELPGSQGSNVSSCPSREDRDEVSWVEYFDDARAKIPKPWHDEHGMRLHRWYPDPNVGWDLMAYNFGQKYFFSPPQNVQNEAQFGYILFSHRYTGIMRLFVWIPPPPGGQSLNYDQLTATISVIRVNDAWPFANSPHVRGKPDLTVVWASDPNNANSAIQPSSWLRAEFATLYDPSFYPSLGIAFPNDPNETFTPIVKIIFAAYNREDLVGSLAGNIGLNGTALASESERGNLSVAKDALIQFYEKDWVAGARSTFGFLAGNTLPSFDVSLAGEVTGQIEGVSISYPLGSGDVFFRLWQPHPAGPQSTTSTTGDDGGPAAIQRCKDARWGALYFTDAHRGGDRDPRPRIPVMLNECLTYPRLFIGASGCNPQNGRTRKARMRLGLLKVREELNIQPILPQSMTLEVVVDRDIREPGRAGSIPGNQSCPDNLTCFNPEVILRATFLLDGGASHTLSEPGSYYTLSGAGVPPPTVRLDDWLGNWQGIPGGVIYVTGRIKAYVRWRARIQVPGQESPLFWDYALDVTDRLEFLRCGLHNSGCTHQPTDW